MDTKELTINSNLKPRKYATIQEAIDDANSVWLANIDTLVAKAILQHQITDIQQITLLQRQTIDGFEFSLRIKDSAKVNQK